MSTIIVIMLNYSTTLSQLFVNICVPIINSTFHQNIGRGGGPRGARGPGPPLKLKIYGVKVLKICKISLFVVIGPPLNKNCSLAPAYKKIKHLRFAILHL